jgi:hypothetical protein
VRLCGMIAYMFQVCCAGAGGGVCVKRGGRGFTKPGACWLGDGLDGGS